MRNLGSPVARRGDDGRRTSRVGTIRIVVAGVLPREERNRVYLSTVTSPTATPGVPFVRPFAEL